jgi:hypothetical protein
VCQEKEVVWGIPGELLKAACIAGEESYIFEPGWLLCVITGAFVCIFTHSKEVIEHNE